MPLNLMMAAIAPPAPARVPLAGGASPSRPVAVLAGGCEGYPAGTHGEVRGARQGCVVFAPSQPRAVARWAVPRAELLVPPALLVMLP